MNNPFFIVVNDQQAGPFTLDELKEIKIHRDTLVWKEGLSEWTRAEDIQDLNELFRSIPPPIPTTEKLSEQSPPPIPGNQSKPVGKYFGYELAQRRERFFAAILESLVLAIPILIIFGGEYYSADQYSADAFIGNIILASLLGAFFYPMFGGNIGHRIMGLQVISSETGAVQSSAIKGAIREAIKGAFSYLFIPIIWLIWDENNQNLYDKVVKTYVVKKKRVL